MKLSEIVCDDAIVPVLNSADRDEVITELVTALGKAGAIKKDKCSEIAESVIKRENEASTGIGKGVAVPHAKHGSLKDVVVAVGCNSDGIEFASLDKQPVYSVILLLSPADDADRHLRAMENIFKNLQSDDFRSFLRQAQTVEQIKDAIGSGEE